MCAMADPAYNVGTNGPLSVALSQRLITFEPQQAAMDNFAQKTVAVPPVSVNAWSNAFEQIEKGRIIGNVFI